jgi:cation diffusion facilitator family transporter
MTIAPQKTHSTEKHKLRSKKDALRMSKENMLFKQGEKAASLSAFVLFALSILKGSVAVLSGSIALLADTIHSFSDIFSSIAVWAGLKLIQKKPSEKFPYGYYKAETFSLLTVSLIITVSGALILKESTDQLFEPKGVSFPVLALTTAGLSALVSYVLARIKGKTGLKIGSQSLVSEGKHSLVDVYTSLLVVAGVLISQYGYFVAQVLVGLAIGVYVIKVGLWFGKDSVLVLMDACLSPQRAKEMREIAESVHGVKGVHNIRLRKSGPVSFGEMEIELQDDLPLNKAYMISEEIGTKIRKQLKDIESITIQMGPAVKERIKIAIPVLEDKGLESMTALHFGKAPYFAFVVIEKGQIEMVCIRVNEAAGMTQKKGIAVSHLILDQKVDVLLAGGVGEGPFHVLRDSSVQIYYLPKSVEIREAVYMLNQGILDRMVSPTQNHEKDSRQ